MDGRRRPVNLNNADAFERKYVFDFTLNPFLAVRLVRRIYRTPFMIGKAYVNVCFRMDWKMLSTGRSLSTPTKITRLVQPRISSHFDLQRLVWLNCNTQFNSLIAENTSIRSHVIAARVGT